MKVVAQRVLKAKCEVDGKITGQIDNGLMILVGFTPGDNKDTIEKMAQKVVNLRIFEDENGVMNLSVLDTKGSILSISQFTLYADTKKGNRPSYINALGGEKASPLYDLFNEELSKHVTVKTGVFGAEMQIDFTNNGPVTIILEK
jgi:D-tyrosyl-tRNA(Tyr) deacylase